MGFIILFSMHIIVAVPLFLITNLIAFIFSNLQLYQFQGFLSLILFYFVFGIGLSQLLYGIPLVVQLKRQEKWGQMKGVIIGMVVTALLNGGCWLTFLSYFR